MSTHKVVIYNDHDSTVFVGTYEDCTKYIEMYPDGFVILPLKNDEVEVSNTYIIHNTLFSCVFRDYKFSSTANPIIYEHLININRVIESTYSIMSDEKLSNSEKVEAVDNINYGILDIHKFGEQIRDSIKMRSGDIMLDNEGLNTCLAPNAKDGSDNVQGECPSCGSDNLEYGVILPNDDGVEYPYTCMDCSDTGIEYYNLAFNGIVSNKRSV